MLTSREMFSGSLLGDQMYHRIPITDEHAPLPETFDQIINVLKTTPPCGSQYCFAWNCQMGRGRTTTGMVICCLLSLHWPNSNIQLSAPPSPRSEEDADPHLAGNFKIIKNLIRVLPKGPRIKQETDRVIDLCSTMQNLRLAISEMKQRSESAVTATMRSQNHERAIDYLTRYFYLIAFNAFLWDWQGIGADSALAPNSFQSWIEDRPEITNLLKKVDLV